MNGRSSPGGIRAPDDRLKHEARLIHENEVRSSRRRGLQDDGERFSHPPLDRGIVSVLVMMLRPLACPIKVSLQDPGNVSGMILNSEVGLDNLGYTACSPEIIGPAVRRRTLRQQFFQRPAVLCCQATMRTRGWRTEQGRPSTLASNRHPATYRGHGDSQGFGNIPLAPPLLP